MIPVIAVDFDDVIYPFNASFMEWHNRTYGTRHTYQDLTSYKMEEVWGCNTETIIERAQKFWQAYEYRLPRPITGSQEGIVLLAKIARLEVVTSRPKYIASQTIDFAERYFPDCFSNIHLTNSFAPKAGTNKYPKSEICRNIGACIIIEDAMSHATELAKSGISVIMPDRPWNQGEVPEGVVRAKSWEDIVRQIEQIIQ